MSAREYIYEITYPRNFLVNLQGITKARVLFYEEITRPAFSSYEVFMTISAYVELTSSTFFIYEELAKPAFLFTMNETKLIGRKTFRNFL